MGFSRLARRFNLSDFAYAHRGLWSPEGPAENSLQACLKAAHSGLGIEFDLRPSADNVAMVFHDAILDRMTAHDGLFETFSADELSNMSLRPNGNIFTFEALLGAWPGETPLLCELKIDGVTDPVTFAETIGQTLLAYPGPAAAMSFSRQAVRALPESVMRGQLIDASVRVGEEAFQRFTSSINRHDCDYIACHTSDAERCRQLADHLGLPVITWTVKDIETAQRLKNIVDAQIFEGFDPCFVKPN